MKHVEIEWRYPDKEEECLYCAESGRDIREFISELAQGLEAESVKVTFTKNQVSVDESSPALLVNGTPLEKVLEGDTLLKGGCPTCTPIVGKKVRFLRTLRYRGSTYLEVPEAVVKRAVRKLADLE